MLTLKENIKNYDPELIREDCYNRFSRTVVAEKLIQIYNDVLAKTTGVS